MQTYPVKPAMRSRLTPDSLAEVLTECFGTADRSGEEAVSRYGAIEELRVRPEKKGIGVVLTMNPKVDAAVAAETIRRYNRFLETATGYNAKERARRLRKSAGTEG